MLSGRARRKQTSWAAPKTSITVTGFQWVSTSFGSCRAKYDIGGIEGEGNRLEGGIERLSLSPLYQSIWNV